MDDKVYQKLAYFMAGLGDSFPQTENRLEIKILKRIFTPKEAIVYCAMDHHFKSVDEIALNLDLSRDETEKILFNMKKKEIVTHYSKAGKHYFEQPYWAKELLDAQVKRLDKDFAIMVEEYTVLQSKTPNHWLILPIEQEIKGGQIALPYERVSAIVDKNESFMFIDCYCRKSKEVLGEPCQVSEKSICMVISTYKNAFNGAQHGRPITKDEAKAHFKRSLELGLVNMSHNYQEGKFFICSCCSCCCDTLSAIRKLGYTAPEAMNSSFFSKIDTDKCIACGVCADERCPVEAIELIDGGYKVNRERCLGCGVCGPTCPEDAINLHRKSEDQINTPLVTYQELLEAKGDKSWSEDD